MQIVIKNYHSSRYISLCKRNMWKHTEYFYNIFHNIIYLNKFQVFTCNLFYDIVVTKSTFLFPPGGEHSEKP